MTNTTGSPNEPWPWVDSDRHGWPIGPKRPSEVQKALYNARLDVRKKRTEEDIARAQAERNTDLAVAQAYYSAVLDLAKGAVDRTRASAETVQKAAAAIATIYTGLLAAAFAAASHPLPFRGLFAATLLGLAIALSTWFLAYIPDPDEPEEGAAEDGEIEELSLRDKFARTYVLWTRKAALSRGYPLRASVIALAAALFFLPAPFLEKGKTQASTQTVTWPTVPSEPTAAELKERPAAADLEKILYTAKVAEAAEGHKAAVADEANETFWLIAFVVAIALVFGVPLVSNWVLVGGAILALIVVLPIVITRA
jgi:hypothetical protein